MGSPRRSRDGELFLDSLQAIVEDSLHIASNHKHMNHPADDAEWKAISNNIGHAGSTFAELVGTAQLQVDEAKGGVSL